MIYTTGTVNTVSGSAIVKGTGTKFKNNNPAINIGMTILIKSGNTNIPYMIKSVNSDTELVLAHPALATATNTTFSIHITEPDNNSDAARTMVAINSYVEYFLDAMNTWMTQTGQTKIEMPNGEVVTLDSIKKMQGDISKKLSPGDFGLGYKATSNQNPPQITFKDADEIDFSGFATGNGSGAINFSEAYFPLLSFARFGGSDNTGQVSQIQSYMKSGFPVLTTRSRNNGKWSSWHTAMMLTHGGNQYGVAELAMSRAIGVAKQGDDDNAMWMSLARGEPDIYLKRKGKPNRIYTFPANGGEFLVWDNHIVAGGVDSYGNGSINGANGALRLYRNNSGIVTIYSRGEANGDASYTTNQRVPDGSGNLLSTTNTTYDSNGFVKRASPIIDINPDGTFTTNDESGGATVTRVAKGEYLIEGVLGFNSDAGWGGVDGGIEIPLDVNKQPLIWVDSEINRNGSILVKTYHRTHPNAPEFARNDIDGYSDGDPIDIPDGRFISVRVQMPEQSIYNVRMREMEEAQKVEEGVKSQFGLGENGELL